MFKVNQQIRIKTGAELQAAGHKPSAGGSYYSVRYTFLKEMEEKLSGKQFKIKSVERAGELFRLHGDDYQFSISEDMIAEEMFKAGDKVRIMSFEKMEELYEKDSAGDLDIIVNEQSQAYFVQSMKDLCGKEYTIVSIDEDGECKLDPSCNRWCITTGMLELIERESHETIEEEVVGEIKVGDVVRVKTMDELITFEEEHGRTPMFGWNDSMDELCGKMFSVTRIVSGRVYGLDTLWSISTEMLVKVSAKELFKKLEEVRSGLKETPLVAISPKIESAKDDKKLFSGIELGTEYYYLDSDGEIEWYESGEDSTDEDLYERANCFTSYDAAEKIRDLQLLQREMLRFAEEHNAHICDWSDEDEPKYELNRANVGEWQVDSWGCYNNPFSVYFNSREVAEKALEKFGDRLEAIYE